MLGVDLQGLQLKYYSLSWKGHEYLDAFRDINQWNNIKKVISKAGGLAFDAALAMIMEYGKDELRKVLGQ